MYVYKHVSSYLYILKPFAPNQYIYNKEIKKINTF